MLKKKYISIETLFNQLIDDSLSDKDKKKLYKSIEKLYLKNTIEGSLLYPLSELTQYHIPSACHSFIVAEKRFGNTDEFSLVYNNPYFFNKVSEINDRYFATQMHLSTVKAICYEKGIGVKRDRLSAMEIMTKIDFYGERRNTTVFVDAETVYKEIMKITDKDFVEKVESRRPTAFIKYKIKPSESLDLSDILGSIGEEGIVFETNKTEFRNGDVYEGQLFVGNPEGEGTYTWKNGDYYDGEWKNGLRVGKGIESLNGETWLVVYADDYPIERIKMEKGKIDLKKIPTWDLKKNKPFFENKSLSEEIFNTVNMLINPNSIEMEEDRRLERSYNLLTPFMKKAQSFFENEDDTEFEEIIFDILRVTRPQNEIDYSGCKYFSEGVAEIFDWIIENCDDYEEFDVDTIIVSMANIATYFDKVFGLDDFYDFVACIWRDSGKERNAEFLWFLRRCKIDFFRFELASDLEYYYNLEANRYEMGSNCEFIY